MFQKVWKYTYVVILSLFIFSCGGGGSGGGSGGENDNNKKIHNPPSTPSYISGYSRLIANKAYTEVSWGGSTYTDNLLGRFFYLVSYKKSGGSYGTEKVQSDIAGSDYYNELEQGKTYFFRVRAVNTSFELYSSYAYSEGIKIAGSPKPETIPTPKENKAPTTPTNVEKSFVSSSYIRLKWNKSTDDTSYISYYYVSYKESGGSYGSEKRTFGTRETFYSLKEGTTYFFRVRTKDGDGAYSAYGYSDGIKTQGESVADNTAPTTPTNIQSTLQLETSISLSWDASTDTKDSHPYYYVSYKESGGSYGSEESTIITSDYITGLKKGTTYFFRVRAKDDQGAYSSYGYSEGIKTDGEIENTPPTTPTNIVSTLTGKQYLYINWNASTDSSDSTLSYYISYKEDGGTYGAEKQEDNPSAAIILLQPSTTYFFRVRAKDSDGAYSAYGYSEGIKIND